MAFLRQFCSLAMLFESSASNALQGCWFYSLYDFKTERHCECIYLNLFSNLHLHIFILSEIKGKVLDHQREKCTHTHAQHKPLHTYVHIQFVDICKWELESAMTNLKGLHVKFTTFAIMLLNVGIVFKFWSLISSELSKIEPGLVVFNIGAEELGPRGRSIVIWGSGLENEKKK